MVSVSLHIRPRTLVLDTNILVRSQKSYDTITFICNCHYHGGPPSTTSLLDHCFVRYFSILYAMVDHLTDTLCHRSITWPRWRSLLTMATGRSEYQQLLLLSWRCKFMIIMMMMITMTDRFSQPWSMKIYQLSSFMVLISGYWWISISLIKYHLPGSCQEWCRLPAGRRFLCRAHCAGSISKMLMIEERCHI